MRLGITLIALDTVLSICEYSSVTFLSFISKLDVLKKSHLLGFFKSDLLLALEWILFNIYKIIKLVYNVSMTLLHSFLKKYD